MICFICKNQSNFFCKKNGFRIYKCNDCGFGMTMNLSRQIGDYHRDDEYIDEKNLFENIFLKRVNLISKFANPERILEVGCSTGLMLSIFKQRGGEVVGVEISKKAAKVAQDRGIEVMELPFEKINTNEKFDLIIFNHTLEHLKDPLTSLKKAKSLLRPKGYLYIDLPNFESLSARLWKGRWGLLLPEEHLWHFTEESFKKAFKQLGFKIIYVEKTSGVWDFSNPLKELFFSLTTLKKRFFKEFLTFLPSLIVSKVGQGSDLMVIARKK